MLDGTEEILKIKHPRYNNQGYAIQFEGIVNFISGQHEENQEGNSRTHWAAEYMNQVECPECEGTRLKKQALWFKIARKNIAELSSLDIGNLQDWFEGIEERMEGRQKIIAAEVLKEIRNRIGFLMEVGLDYLTLNRAAGSLSGGEAQRIRLATQIGSKLVGVLYILDEPSIGLHQRDNVKLIKALKDLRDSGNSVLVVEHDKDMILEADHVIDIGPGAGVHGGRIVSEGAPKALLLGESSTAAYINGTKSIEVPSMRRKGNGKSLKLIGAQGNNLKNVNLNIPLGTFVCITGVSGSGKSTLINETLYPALSKHSYQSHTAHPVSIRLEVTYPIDKATDTVLIPIVRN